MRTTDRTRFETETARFFAADALLPYPPEPPAWLDPLLAELGSRFAPLQRIRGLAAIGSQVGGWATPASDLDIVLIPMGRAVHDRAWAEAIAEPVGRAAGRSLDLFYASDDITTSDPRWCRLIYGLGRFGLGSPTRLLSAADRRRYARPIRPYEVQGLIVNNLLGSGAHVARRLSGVRELLSAAWAGDELARETIAHEIHFVRHALRHLLLIPTWLTSATKDRRDATLLLDEVLERLDAPALATLRPWLAPGDHLEGLDLHALASDRAVARLARDGHELFLRLGRVACEHPAVLATNPMPGDHGYGSATFERRELLRALFERDLRRHRRRRCR